jgi:UDP-glucose 4-epimerase
MPETLRGRCVLVTGGCGFIGSHLVARLLSEEVSRLVVIDSAEPRPGWLGPSRERVEFVRHRLGVDLGSLQPHLHGVDTLFHLAARKHNTSHDAPFDVLSENVGGTYALLRAAAHQAVRHVVFSSSLYAYGRMNGPAMSEEETPQPDTVYGISKLAGERLLANVHKEIGLSHTALRFFFVYGPDQRAGLGYESVIVKNFERLSKNEAPVVFGDGEQALDYVYIDDVLDALFLAATRPEASGEVFNVGSGAATRVAALTDEMILVSGQAARRATAPADWTAGSYRVARIDKIRGSLGWAPKVTLRDGLARTWAPIEAARREARHGNS